MDSRSRPRWHVRDANGSRGPYDSSELRALVARGVLKPEHEICREGTTEWKPATALVGLFPKEAAPPSPRPGSGDGPSRDVFVSHSHQDKPIADALVHVLEERGIRCWIAPRDIVPGTNWSASIMKGLIDSRVLVLIFSRHSNCSQQVLQEVERAVNRGLAIMPFRIEEVPLEPALELFIGSRHWLDALSPPMEQHLELLAGSVESLLGTLGRVVPPRISKPRKAAAEAAPRRRVLPVALGALLTAGIGLATWRFWPEVDVPRHDDPPVARPGDVEPRETVSQPVKSEPARQESEAPKVPALVSWLQAGQKFELGARSGSRPSIRLELRILSLGTGGRDVMAVLADPAQMRDHVVYEGTCGPLADREAAVLRERKLTTADSGLTLRPRASANLPAGLPLGNDTLVLVARSDKEVAGVCGAFDLVGGRSGNRVDLVREPREAGLSHLVEGARWEGSSPGTGRGSIPVLAEVARCSDEGGVVWLSLSNRENPWERIVLTGSFAPAWQDAYGWPVRLRRAVQQVEGVPLLGQSVDLAIRVESGDLIVAAGDTAFRLEAADAARASVAEGLEEALAVGNALEGKALASGRGPAFVRFVVWENENDGASIRASVTSSEDPLVHFALRGELQEAGDPGFEAWPITLHRQESAGKPVNSISLLGYSLVNLSLRPTEDGGLIGWCGGERIELVAGKSVAVPATRAEADRRLLEACAPGTAWEGTATSPGSPPISVRLVFQACDATGSRIEAEATSPDRPGIVAGLAGWLETSTEGHEGWPLRFDKKSKLEGARYENTLFGYYDLKRIPMRLGIDGHLYGNVEGEVLDLQRAGPGAPASQLIEASSSKTVTSGEISREFYTVLDEVDALLDAENPAEAEKRLKKLRRDVEEDSDQEVFLELRLARLEYAKGKNSRTPSVITTQCHRAREKFKKLIAGDRDPRDHRRVSTKAMAHYYVLLTAASMAYVDPGNQDRYLPDAEEAYAALKRDYPGEKDAAGTTWVRRADQVRANFR